VSHNYYHLLGVSRTATKKEIKMAYFQMAKKTHPDANPGDVNAKKKFQEIAEAYTVLGDDDSRRDYDEYPFNFDLPGFSNDYSTKETPAQRRQRRKEQEQRNPFKPPHNANPHHVLKQMFVDVGIQELINSAENTKQAAISAADSAEKGNWNPAKIFVSKNKILIVSVMAPLVLLVRFPWIIGLIIRCGTVALVGVLTLMSRDPRIAFFVGIALYKKYMATAARLAAKKAGKK
jgi:hypothetical protein